MSPAPDLSEKEQVSDDLINEKEDHTRQIQPYWIEMRLESVPDVSDILGFSFSAGAGSGIQRGLSGTRSEVEGTAVVPSSISCRGTDSAATGMGSRSQGAISKAITNIHQTRLRPSV